MRLALLCIAAACSDYNFSDKVHSDPGDTGFPVETAEPTVDCRDFAPPAAPAPDPDDTCLNEPAVGTFTPVVEWQWSTDSVWGTYDQVMMTPVVGPLDDDDGDGDIDEDDTPDIVFSSYAGSAYSSEGAVTAISGDGSGTLWSITSAGGYTFMGTAGIALGDLEGDGTVEVCVAGYSVTVVCLHGADGSLLWAAGSTAYARAFPSIADMDGDGRAEVIVAASVFDASGNQVGAGGYGIGGASSAMSVAVDMDADGQLELVAGNSVYELDGTLVWNDGGSDGMPAVGDFDDDGLPEVVRVTGGTVILSDTDGTTLWTSTIPGTGNGGPPTVADFDGDGEPEVGVANLSYYSLLDTDGAVLWSNPTEDDSSSVTGSSVFDFEGDGAAEVVYADEHALYVYDGATGAVLLQADGHASGTLWEYPVIADVDGDGSTEIVVPSNDMWWEGWTGITVIGDAGSTWAPARPVWNQHAYHITNVENDLGIPAVQTPNWLSWNNFRAGGTELGPSSWLADLFPGDPSVCLDECDQGHVIVYVAVGNEGLLVATEFAVTLYSVDAGMETEVTSEVVSPIDTGQGTVLGPFVLDESDWGPGRLVARLDAADAVAECDEEDNDVVLGTWPCASSR